MRKKRVPIEVIGLSFLDMICCAFGGVVVLYSLTPRTEATPETFLRGFTTIQVESAGEQPIKFGMIFSYGDNAVECLSDECTTVPGYKIQTTNTFGSRRVLIVGPKNDVTKVGIVALSGSLLLETNCIDVRITTDDLAFSTPLKSEFSFRRMLPSLKLEDGKC